MLSSYEIDRLAYLFVQQLECRPWEMDEIELPAFESPRRGSSDSDLEGEDDDEAE